MGKSAARHLFFCKVNSLRRHKKNSNPRGSQIRSHRIDTTNTTTILKLLLRIGNIKHLFVNKSADFPAAAKDQLLTQFVCFFSSVHDNWSWVPVVACLVGGVLGALLYIVFIELHHEPVSERAHPEGTINYYFSDHDKESLVPCESRAMHGAK